ncbi:TIGR03943 family putative permease subunit [Sinosporangium album]|uniref:TIGR03943 family putative permease subunit n=1 Tax=Sinosporangium album TaxID=504805 RepID=UPI000A42FDD5|nr:TIGR03943 family protein [Sinosporangium album]
MSRWSQNLVLILLGGATVWISAFTTSYLNYVKAGFQPFLVAAGAIVIVLGVAGLVRPAAHEHAPRVAWLMTLPVFAIVLIAPPALGSFAAERSQRPPEPPQNANYAPLSASGPTIMKIGEFMGRAFGDEPEQLNGKVVKLTGFVTKAKKKDQWHLTRMSIACCAADGYALHAAIVGAPAPKLDSWVEVTGTWVPPKWKRMPNGFVVPELAASEVRAIETPAEPYE